MKNTSRKILIILAAVLLLALAGCAAGDLKAPAADEGVTPQKVSGTCTLTRSGDTLRVSAHLDLMDGVNLRFALDAYDGKSLAEATYLKAGDDLYAEFAIDPKWEGKVYGSVICEPDSIRAQAKEVTAAYGKRFQNITGDDVIFNAQGNIFVIQSEPLDLG